MELETKEKTALGASVGADAGQSIHSQTAQIITGETPEISDLEDISQEKFFLQMQRMQDPAYLHTVSMNELYETVYEGKQAVIDGLLYAGTYQRLANPSSWRSWPTMSVRDKSFGNMKSTRERFCIWLWKMITSGCRNECPECLVWRERINSTLRSVLSNWGRDWTNSWKNSSGSIPIPA